MYRRDYSEWRECEDALAAVRAAMPSDPQAHKYVVRALTEWRPASLVFLDIDSQEAGHANKAPE